MTKSQLKTKIKEIIANEKISVGMIAFGLILIGWGYRKPNVKTN